MCDNKRLWKLAEVEEYVSNNRPARDYDFIMSYALDLPFIREARDDERCGFVFDGHGFGTVHLIIKAEPWNVNEKTGSSNIGFYVITYDHGATIHVWDAYQDEYGIRDGSKVGDYSVDDIKSLDDFIRTLENDADTCPVCGKKVGRENMKRFCYAGRCCEDCLPAMKNKYETAGWYN